MDSCKVLSKTPGLTFYTLMRGSVEDAFRGQSNVKWELLFDCFGGVPAVF